MPAYLHLLGPPAVVFDTGAAQLPLPAERRGQLLALLALRPGWIPRAEVAALLWPDVPPKQAFANLRKTIFRTQEAPWGALLQVRDTALRVDIANDVQDFEQALRAPAADDALALYRGPLLAGFDNDANEAWTDWLHFERARLQALWREAALARLGAGDEAGPTAAVADAVALSARLLAADPLDEAAMQAHLEALLAGAQAAKAAQLGREFAQRLHDELGLAPNAALLALQQRAAEGLSTSAVPSAAPRRAATAPAHADDGFIGRSAERRQAAALLARDDVRLLCLTGPGGIGKTRLARRVAQDLADGFADGLRIVRLEDADSADALVARIARETETALQGRLAPLQQLAQALRQRRLLLLLDNLEQLAEVAAPVLHTLLEAAPGLKLLATSRVRLGCADEHVLPLEGLPCPEPEDADRLDDFDASRLFLAVARRVSATAVPAAEFAAVVDICRQVDGLPLALEMAAAWTRMLSCDAIAHELRESTALLRTSDASAGGAADARHTSIEQVFDPSWRRLTPPEREALSALSVFQGGFSPEAARAVTGSAWPVLAALADKSLLRKEGARLSLHPLVQQLAGARLDAAAHHAAREAHARYFRHLLLQRRAAVKHGDRQALAAVDTDMENCRRAWQWALRQGDAGALHDIGEVLQRHLDARGRYEECLALLRQAIDAPSVRSHGALQAWLLGEAAQCEYRLDRYAEADALVQPLLARGDDDVPPSTRLRACNVAGSCALRQGRHADARGHFEQALAVARAEQDAEAVSVVLDHLALVEKYLGHHDAALALSLQALTEHRRHGDLSAIALCLCNLGSLYLTRDEHAAARPHLEEAQALCEREGLAGTLTLARANLCEVRLLAGDLGAAHRLCERTAEAARESGNRLNASWAALMLARCRLREGNADGARASLAEGVAGALATGAPLLHGLVLLAFAELLKAQGDDLAAARVLAMAEGDRAMAAGLGRRVQAVQRALAPLPAPTPLAQPLPLAELLHRVAAETLFAQAPLRALLNAA